MTLADHSLRDYLTAVAARQSTPGGGAVAAIVAAEGCALLAMVAEFTRADAMANIAARNAETRSTLLALADEDGKAFAQVMRAYRGDGELEQALAAAARVPVRVFEICEHELSDLRLLARDGNPNLTSDTRIAALLLKASAEACEINIMVNVRGMKGSVPEDIQQTLPRIAVFVQEAALIASTTSDPR